MAQANTPRTLRIGAGSSYAHGKSYSALILSMPVEVNADIAAQLEAAGRKPIPKG